MTGWATPPTMTGWGTPHHDWMAYPPPPTSIASTCYAAGGMPLAFTQFSGKTDQMICWCPLLGLVPPPLGNPGSATVRIIQMLKITKETNRVRSPTLFSGRSKISQRSGCQSQRGERQHTIWPFFPDNYKKIKKFGQRGVI